MNGGHQDKGTNKGHDGNEKVFWTVVGNLADFFQIFGDMRDDMTCFILS